MVMSTSTIALSSANRVLRVMFCGYNQNIMVIMKHTFSSFLSFLFRFQRV
jgi:hypothetical protein